MPKKILCRKCKQRTRKMYKVDVDENGKTLYLCGYCWRAAQRNLIRCTNGYN